MNLNLDIQMSKKEKDQLVLKFKEAEDKSNKLLEEKTLSLQEIQKLDQLN